MLAMSLGPLPAGASARLLRKLPLTSESSRGRLTDAGGVEGGGREAPARASATPYSDLVRVLLREIAGAASVAAQWGTATQGALCTAPADHADLAACKHGRTPQAHILGPKLGLLKSTHHEAAHQEHVVSRLLHQCSFSARPLQRSQQRFRARHVRCTRHVCAAVPSLGAPRPRVKSFVLRESLGYFSNPTAQLGRA